MEATFTRAQLIELQAEHMDVYLQRVRDYAKSYVLRELRGFAKRTPTAHEYYHPILNLEGRQFVEDVTTELSLLLPEFRVSCITRPLFQKSMAAGYIIINWSTERDIK